MTPFTANCAIVFHISYHQCPLAIDTFPIITSVYNAATRYCSFFPRQKVGERFCCTLSFRGTFSFCKIHIIWCIRIWKPLIWPITSLNGAFLWIIVIVYSMYMQSESQQRKFPVDYQRIQEKAISNRFRMKNSKGFKQNKNYWTWFHACHVIQTFVILGHNKRS